MECLKIEMAFEIINEDFLTGAKIDILPSVETDGALYSVVNYGLKNF